MRIRKNVSASNSGEIEQLAKTADALAHPVRVKIFRYILACNSERKPVRNKDVVAAFPFAQATISQHMNKLIIGGLVEARPEGASVYYYANIGMIGRHIQQLRTFDPEASDIASLHRNLP
ncbi:MAG: helix-turn-helix domain-containing protein [Clostridiales Family XIII bacterium]|jgi:ArsR family transcriptional regulator|nr:helix-turn-helix domain-containing protein [Clostridiales Family XIII bacterium]